MRAFSTRITARLPISPALFAKLLGVGVSAFCVAACAIPRGTAGIAQVSIGAVDVHLDSSVGVEACRAALGAPTPGSYAGLDADRIRVANWNVKKGSRPSWEADFTSLTDGADLVLIQEASLREDTVNAIDASRHWSFAPGYRRGSQVSGVMTLSSVEPFARCSLVSTEPVLRTPKATSITKYGIADIDMSLVVVNVHAVNFSLGLGAYRRQLRQIRDALDLHEGPVVLSGDFNTWRQARMRIVNELAAELGLESVSFETDLRTTVFGQRLDHLFVRGLDAVRADTLAVTTSDHNPMSATLRL